MDAKVTRRNLLKSFAGMAAIPQSGEGRRGIPATRRHHAHPRAGKDRG